MLPEQRDGSTVKPFRALAKLAWLMPMILAIGMCGLGVTMVVPATAQAVTQAGQCNAFGGAYPLGTAYSDSEVTVPACGPLPTKGGPPVHPYPGSLATPGYQCVEFAERYLYYVFDATMGSSTNGDQIVDHYVAKYPSLFVAIGNGSVGQAPVQGDVISFSKVASFNSGSGGHTAVVQSSRVNGAGTGTINIVEENAAVNGSATVAVNNWRVTYGSFPYIKWLHPRNGAAGSGSALPTHWEVGFQASGTGSLWAVGADSHGSLGLGVLSGTSPSITRLTNGGWEEAFQASDHSLWVVGSDDRGSLGLGMATGTSPDITAMPNGGWEVAFQANTGSLWVVGSDNHGSLGLGMAAGTSPSITTLKNGGWEVAFQANTGSLWVVGSDNHGSLGLGMAPHSSPAITAMPNGSWEAAFQANTGALFVVGTDNHGTMGLGMASGTSPSITTLANGGWEVAFQANTGSLWVVGSDDHGSMGLGMAAGTNPDIAGVASGWEVAFQANTGALWAVGEDNHGSLGLGVMSQTSPAITAY